MRKKKKTRNRKPQKTREPDCYKFSFAPSPFDYAQLEKMEQRATAADHSKYLNVTPASIKVWTLAPGRDPKVDLPAEGDFLEFQVPDMQLPGYRNLLDHFENGYGYVTVGSANGLIMLTVWGEHLGDIMSLSPEERAACSCTVLKGSIINADDPAEENIPDPVGYELEIPVSDEVLAQVKSIHDRGLGKEGIPAVFTGLAPAFVCCLLPEWPLKGTVTFDSTETAHVEVPEALCRPYGTLLGKTRLGYSILVCEPRAPGAVTLTAWAACFEGIEHSTPEVRRRLGNIVRLNDGVPEISVEEPS